MPKFFYNYKSSGELKMVGNKKTDGESNSQSKQPQTACMKVELKLFTS